MTYRTLLVHVDIGASNEAIFRVAGDIAERFEATVIGVSACQPLSVMYYSDAYGVSDIIAQDSEDIEKKIKIAEERFRAALQTRAREIEWRSAFSFDPLEDFIARQARAADLVLIDPKSEAPDFDPSRRVQLGDLLMRLGRPMLIVQADEPSVDLENIVIGWKDTREAQRAVASALPLLKRATHVTIVEVAPKEDLSEAREHVQDVAKWLARHGIKAAPIAAPEGDDEVSSLSSFLQESNAGLLVAGAYGHSRMREWIFGGVTRNLLLQSQHCAFVSH